MIDFNSKVIKNTKAKKALVLLSGGLDSLYNYSRALDEYDALGVVFFNYAQNAFRKEQESSKALYKNILNLNIEPLGYFELDFSWLKIYSRSALNESKDLPLGHEVDINDFTASEETASKVWVPNRNGLFINAAASIAESLGGADLIVGFNKEEALTFPDNSKEFVESINLSLGFSTSKPGSGLKVILKCFSLDMKKTQIIEDMVKRNYSFDNIWSCYQDGDKHCGSCESCKRLKRALIENNSVELVSFANL